MAAIPSSSSSYLTTFNISPPPPPLPPSHSSSLRRLLLRSPPVRLTSSRPSSLPPSLEIVSFTECSDGSLLFHFGDATQVSRLKDQEIGQKMEGSAEISLLPGAQTEVESENLESDVVIGTGLGSEGYQMCLETERLGKINGSIEQNQETGEELLVPTSFLMSLLELGATDMNCRAGTG